MKVRGVRVEPMEITVALQECPASRCAVLARERDRTGWRSSATSC